MDNPNYVEGSVLSNAVDEIDDSEKSSFDNIFSLIESFGSETLISLMTGAAETKKRKKYEPKQYDPEPVADIDPTLTTGHMLPFIYAELVRKKIAGHHIDGLNSFYSEGLRQIVTKIFKIEGRIKNTRDHTEEDRSIDEIGYAVEFTNVELVPPTTNKYKSGVSQPMLPNMARLQNLTYSCQMLLSATITTTAYLHNGTIKERKDEFKDHKTAKIPCATGTIMCHTNGASPALLKSMQEDPKTCGAVFIIKGNEWTINNLENKTNNAPHIYNNMYMNERSRCEFLSKPGDAFENSYQIILRYLTNGGITLEITTNKFDKFEIPFYLIFRVLGITRDKDIVDNIVYGVDNNDTITRELLQILSTAFDADDPKFWRLKKVTEPAIITQEIAIKIMENANTSAAKKDNNVAKYLNSNILSIIDKYIFPHIGTTVEHRPAKVRFLGHLINKLLLVTMGTIDPTDRDDYGNKRVHSSGPSSGKTFKTNFNFTVVMEIRKRLIREFTSTPFSSIHLAETVKSSIDSESLEKMMVQSIITGDKTITVKRNEITSHISSTSLYYKNDLNAKSTLSAVNTPNTSANKQNERSDKMRRVHVSYPGFIDISQSSEGAAVGTHKQLCCTTSISSASNSFNLKRIILEDPDVLPNDEVMPAQISAEKLAKIIVNGDWIGCCKDSHNLVKKYRNMRRHGDINHTITIVWELSVREVIFWTDIGRLLRPIIIVYNNLEQYIDGIKSGKPIQFKQWIKFTREHSVGLISRKVTMDDLRRERIIEYIAPEEQKNTLIAENINVLRENQHNIQRQYTHCGIDQDIFGLVTLASPMANHSNATRITYWTNHRKQSASWPYFNFPFRIDKNITIQHYNEKPLVSTISDLFTNPNGQNAIVALMVYEGKGQEDSVIINQASIDRGLFNASFLTYEKAKLEKNEEFGNPDRARTMDIRRDAVYEHIDKRGFITEGTLVKKDYVLIVKSAKIQKPTNTQYLYTDKSVIYKSDKEAYITKVVEARDSDGVPICKVQTESLRHADFGDKVSSRHGNKGIIAYVENASDMPYTESGAVIDVIVNPHSIPTRMAINQLIESAYANLAAILGVHIDATAFREHDIEHNIALLEKHGVKYAGHQRVFNGRTGEWIDAPIFYGPTIYMRLQKYVEDENYAVNEGPTNNSTHQPVDGKIHAGGLKIGEMEKDVFAAGGQMRSLYQKFYDDSDGVKIPICRNCYNRAVVNEKIGLYKCQSCGDAADIAYVPSSWVANLIFNYASAMNVKMLLKLAPSLFPIHEM